MSVQNSKTIINHSHSSPLPATGTGRTARPRERGRKGAGGGKVRETFSSPPPGGTDWFVILSADDWLLLLCYCYCYYLLNRYEYCRHNRHAI